jgi:hypothetical protein
MGYGADVGLATMLVEELLSRGLAKPSEDGVSIPLHPTIRRVVLAVLGQLACARGRRAGIVVHPTTNNVEAIEDLISTLRLKRLPSAGHVVTLDMEAVSVNLETVPLDEVLDFRASHLDAHKAYMRSLRGALVDVSLLPEPERTTLLLERQQEIADAAHDLRRATRQSLGKNLAAWSLGAAGGAWSVVGHDPLGFAIGAAGLVTGAIPSGKTSPAAAYSYLFAAARELGRA